MNTEKQTSLENVEASDVNQTDPNLKKQSSYTYWTRDIKSDNEFSSKIQPTKINEEKLPQATQDVKKNSTGSAWNSAGTWEEKHFTKQQVKEFFEKFLPINFKNFSFDKLSSVSGDTFLVFSRGKIKICYDNEMTFEIKGLNEYSDCEGTLKITDITNSEGESMEYDYQKFNGSNVNKFKEAVRGEQRDIEAQLRSIYNKMKE